MNGDFLMSSQIRAVFNSQSRSDTVLASDVFGMLSSALRNVRISTE
jgi:hypothetical protein